MRPPAEARVGLVTDALVALAATVDGLTVSDGPLRQQVTRRDVLIVGDPRPTGRAVSVEERALDTFGGTLAYEEILTVTCSLLSWTGAKDVKPQRDRCVQVMGLLRAGLDPDQGGDQTLGGACERAYLGAQQVATPANDNQGASYSIVFPIVAKTLI